MLFFLVILCRILVSIETGPLSGDSFIYSPFPSRLRRFYVLTLFVTTRVVCSSTDSLLPCSYSVFAMHRKILLFMKSDQRFTFSRILTILLLSVLFYNTRMISGVPFLRTSVLPFPVFSCVFRCGREIVSRATEESHSRGLPGAHSYVCALLN